MEQITDLPAQVFGQGRERNEAGHIVYNRQDEQSLRRQWFTPEAFSHPAKTNLLLTIDLIEHVSKPGEMILDPMAGSGTTLVAAMVGRRVIAIELEQLFHNIQLASIANWSQESRQAITLLKGNCLDFLPFPVDHVIFSPPYADTLGHGGDQFKDQHHTHADGQGESIAVFSATIGNLSRLPRFMYNQEIMKLYRKLYESLRPGGTCSIVIKERYKSGKREPLTSETVRICNQVGFELELWDHRESRSGLNEINLSRGVRQVLDEDIVILRKPQ